MKHTVRQRLEALEAQNAGKERQAVILEILRRIHAAAINHKSDDGIVKINLSDCGDV